MTRFMTTTIAAALFPAAVFAAQHTSMNPMEMTCSDFMAMDMQGQEEAYQAVHQAAMSPSMTSETSGADAGEAQMMDTLNEARNDSERQSGMDNESTDQMEGTAEMAESDSEAMNDGSPTAGGGYEELVAACEGQGDTLAVEAMTAAMDG